MELTLDRVDSDENLRLSPLSPLAKFYICWGQFRHTGRIHLTQYLRPLGKIQLLAKGGACGITQEWLPGPGARFELLRFSVIAPSDMV